MLKARNSADEKKIASAKEVLYSARNKLNSWGFLNKQIVEMAKDPGTSPEIDILAPTSGVVIESNMREGQYFKRGDKLLTIVDTSVMWLMLDAYERDLPFLRYGQKISFTVQSIPGKTFSGRIAFIAPEFDPATRTVMVRANVPNSSGELKAGMFARANVEITLGHGGQVVIDELENKWIGPMHPEIIRSAPGDCPVCGMKLIPASSLPGMHHKKGKLPLLIPASAPLLTGKRAIVYVESKPSVYSAREVVLGPKAGDQYIVKDGLKEGEEVVSRGSFVVDSALQITGGESMMNRLETSDNKGSKELIHSIGSEPLNNLVDAYCQLVQELAADKLAEAKEAAKKIASIELPDELQKNITKPAEELSKSPDISKARHELFVISGELIKLVENNRKMLNAPLYENYCPMAFNNKGAMWLQKNKILINPYFGNAMLHCGSTRKIIKP
jgi:Cu(I)/Ag(I) efflux system membrane fusion protein